MTFFRVIKLGLTNFWRNRWLSLIAILIMTLTLLIVSVFIIFNLVINSTTESIKEKIDLSVYFIDETSEQDIQTVKEIVDARVDVKSIHYVTKEEALAKWREMNISQEVKDQASEENNPLPRSLEVKAKDPNNLDDIYEFLQREELKPLIESISYQKNKDIIKRLINITSFSQKIGFILGIVFIIISILVILNTIRLTIHSREDEIEIMRLVGSTDIFIRIPFIVEALLYALFATVLSLGLVYAGLYYITPMIIKYLGNISLDLQGFFISNLLLVVVLELAISSTIVIICSFISIRKNIKI